MRFPSLSLAAIALCLAAGSAAAQKTQLLVYTALETDQLKAYQEGFNKVHPDIELKWVRDSTGVITAKLLAEKGNPQADAVMGVAASSLALLDKNGMLQPYAPLNLDAIMPSVSSAISLVSGAPAHNTICEFLLKYFAAEISCEIPFCRVIRPTKSTNGISGLIPYSKSKSVSKVDL